MHDPVYMSHFRRTYEIDKLEDLSTATLSVDDVTTSSASLTCDFHNCEGQVAVCYCLDCGDKMCDTHIQVSVR